MAKYIEDLTYWILEDTDESGRQSWRGPFPARCRWDHVSRVRHDANGKEFVNKAEIMVSKDVPVGAYVYRGVSKADRPVDNAYEVKDYENVRNVRGNKRDIVVFV